MWVTGAITQIKQQKGKKGKNIAAYRNNVNNYLLSYKLIKPLSFLCSHLDTVLLF